MSGGVSEPCPSRITSGRRCACVVGNAAAALSPSTRSSAFACSSVIPGFSLPMTPIGSPSSAPYDARSCSGVQALLAKPDTRTFPA